MIDGTGGANQPILTHATTNAALTVVGLNGAATLTVNMPTNLSAWLRVDGDVYVGTNATVTHSADPTKCVALDVGGDLTVDLGGAIWARGKGYVPGSPYAGGGSRYGGVHGGEGGYGDDSTAPATPTYGSITNPVTAGGGGATGDRRGGGIVMIRGNRARIEGVIDAAGYNGGANGGGAGGSVNIRVGELLGNGGIYVNGADGYPTEGGGGGGGGRLAIVLTNSAAFGNLAMSAAGGARGVTSARRGGAGTIYLQGTNQAYGLLIVSNNQAVAESVDTLISPQVTDAVVGDVRLLGTAKFKIDSTRTLTTYGSWSNAATAMTGGTNYGGTVVFAGTSPNPVTVWGGNTWSNLTIAAAGMKTVNFEANKTQFVYGVASFTNVTLQSTQPDTWWYLRQRPGGVGTQDVGYVVVQDSNATNGWAFRAMSGANNGNNVNWIFPPKGTLFMLR